MKENYEDPKAQEEKEKLNEWIKRDNERWEEYIKNDEEMIQQHLENKIPFQTIDWANIEKTTHLGETGTAFWQTIQFVGLRVRVVEYSSGYLADHWCKKGHLVHCLEGEFTSELEDGTTFYLTKGMSYIVSDNASSHRSISKNGVKLLIVDGDFLK